MSQVNQRLVDLIQSNCCITNVRDLCYFRARQPQFAIAPASTQYHHAYLGGLAQHTFEVMEQALAVADLMRRRLPELSLELCSDAVVLVSLYHDWCKIYEYEADKVKADSPKTWHKTNYAQRIGHITGGVLLLQHDLDYSLVRADLEKLPPVDQLYHALLAHHGRPDWGSPVEPQTALAEILHSADMYSSRYGPGKEKRPNDVD